MSTSPSQFTNVGFRFLLPAIDCSLFTGVYLYSTSEGLSYTMAFKMYFQTPQRPLWVGRGHFYESGGLGLVFRLGEGFLKHVSVAVFFDSALFREISDRFKGSHSMTVGGQSNTQDDGRSQVGPHIQCRDS